MNGWVLSFVLMSLHSAMLACANRVAGNDGLCAADAFLAFAFAVGAGMAWKK